MKDCYCMNKYRLNKILSIFLLLTASVLWAGEHPSLLINAREAAQIKDALGRYPVLDKTFNQARARIDRVIKLPIEVPPPGEAGGFAHEKHKQNYRDMQEAGILYVITNNDDYAVFVRDMLYKYAEMYPGLGPHPLSHNQAPGKLFHQMLNETVWLVYTSIAYDCIYNWLKPEDRAYIENNLFNLIVEWFIVENAHEFDRVHNHGTWSVASVGMIGIVLGRDDLVEKALYGTDLSRKGGFIKQLDMLFSPDGYYMEGPYYARYALRPFFIFAEVLQRNLPELKIFEYRDHILKKALYSAFMTTFPDGVFPPINDASQTMDITAPGPVYANNIGYYRYGEGDMNLLGIAKVQDEVLLNGCGLKLAKDLAGHAGSIPDFTWNSVEFTDGADGQQGGIGILRTGTGRDQMMLLMKYGVHGEGHGHFDQLQFLLYDQGREIIPDYGFARWINIETKFGGRYLPENKTYAMQTIAHNTVTVDQKTQNNFDRKEADLMSGKRHFFNSDNPDMQVMSARADAYYPGVNMQRTMFLIRDRRLAWPAIIDLYRIKSGSLHVYDYPIHFRGQLMTTSFGYDADTARIGVVGKNNGYQHLWQEARAALSAGNASITWLDGNRYYTSLMAVDEGSEIVFARTGAGDPSFNLRSEPMFLLRSQDTDHLFATVIEPHGYFNEAQEKSDGARPVLSEIKIIGSNDTASVIEITGMDNIFWRIIVTNESSNPKAKRSVTFKDRSFSWTGDFKVLLEK
jgi:hypothetical protein